VTDAGAELVEVAVLEEDMDRLDESSRHPPARRIEAAPASIRIITVYRIGRSAIFAVLLANGNRCGDDIVSKAFIELKFKRYGIKFL
jgi:hypothetical protein